MGLQGTKVKKHFAYFLPIAPGAPGAGAPQGPDHEKRLEQQARAGVYLVAAEELLGDLESQMLAVVGEYQLFIEDQALEIILAASVI